MGAYESGQSFLAGVLAKLPAEQQAQAKAIFESAEARGAIETIGDGTLARADYSRQSDGLKTKQQEMDDLIARNQSWYDANKAALDTYVQYQSQIDQLKAGGTIGGKPPAAAPGLDEAGARKIASEVVGAGAQDVIAIAAWTAQKTAEHYATFGEVLPTQELIAKTLQARAAGRQDTTLDDTYRAEYGTRLKEKADAAHAKQIEDEVQKRLAEERAKHPVNLPFPVRTEASPLDTLGQADRSGFTADAAAAEYLRLQQARAAV